ncbi:uncharacterized protein LOC110036404 [Phalaenopsis equestris]|uniref:uncharacterized protein LOC110036404 n=1 Tax=Phalaenopsis equestris TaxID=78828 RepID=UPI0009E3763F|nr:uncharacterized protein LOC110036404 [Phalaenopsis equestris]
MWSMHGDFINQVAEAWTEVHHHIPGIKLWLLQKKLSKHLTNWNWKEVGNIDKKFFEAEQKVLQLEQLLVTDMGSDMDLQLANENLLELINMQEALYALCSKGKQNQVLNNSTVNSTINATLFDKEREFTNSLSLTNIPDEKEIWEALKSIDSTKVASPDGFSADFYKKAWHVVKGEVIATVQSFFWGADLPKYFSSSTITLVPKDKTPCKWEDYRPISLTSVTSKIIRKVLVERIQPHLNKLISRNQSAFIRDRNIVDNVLLAQELVLDLDRVTTGVLSFDFLYDNYYPRSDFIRTDVDGYLLRSFEKNYQGCMP